MNYQPISCTFHDYIEHYIVRAEVVNIKFSENVSEISLDSRILDSYTTNTKEEFIEIENYSKHIRLDRIISINEHNLKDFE